MLEVMGSMPVFFSTQYISQYLIITASSKYVYETVFKVFKGFKVEFLSASE